MIHASAAMRIGKPRGRIAMFSKNWPYGRSVRSTKKAMVVPRRNERKATRKAKRIEFKKSRGTVWGMVMLNASDQLVRVKWPIGETGESDQKLPKVKVAIGTTTINRSTAKRIKVAQIGRAHV